MGNPGARRSSQCPPETGGFTISEATLGQQVPQTVFSTTATSTEPSPPLYSTSLVHKDQGSQEMSRCTWSLLPDQPPLPQLLYLVLWATLVPGVLEDNPCSMLGL